MTEAEKYVRSALQQFVSDPPDDFFQYGFLEGLLMVAVEAFEIDEDDPDVKAARAITKTDNSHEPFPGHSHHGG